MLKTGYQIYSVREYAQKNLTKTLERLALIGYKYVEFNSLYGYSAKQVKVMLQGLGLKCISLHIPIELLSKEPRQCTDDLITLGAKYAVVPYIPAESLAGGGNYQNTLKDITKVGQALKAEGLQLLYHNHDFEFEYYNKRTLLDILYFDIPPDILQAQLDVCWIRYANIDPAEYIKKYSGRCPVIHLKDFTADSALKNYSEIMVIEDKERDNFMFKPLGQGVVDIKRVVSAALNAGTEYFIVEQDSSKDKSPFTAAEESYIYLKNI